MCLSILNHLRSQNNTIFVRICILIVFIKTRFQTWNLVERRHAAGVGMYLAVEAGVVGARQRAEAVTFVVSFGG